MPTCISCLENKEPTDFTREHVLPEAYGTFTNNLPRLDCVCHACNQLFGDSIELTFGRDSFEAYLRFRYQVKDREKVGELGSTRIVFSYTGDPIEWRRVLLRLSPEGPGLVVDLVPQVAFKDRISGEWKHFAETDIDRGSLDAAKLDLQSVRLFAPNDDAASRIFQKLAARGLTFPKRERLDSPDITPGSLRAVDIHFKIDRGVRRCVAKIAFNYLASVAGHEFALGADLDEVRRFVLHGESPGHSIVDVNDRPVLANDWPELRQTNGHLIALGWYGFDLVCRVSLFNHLTYRVTLARSFKGIWRHLRSGHLFDVEARRTVPLVSGSDLVLPHCTVPAPPMHLRRSRSRVLS